MYYLSESFIAENVTIEHVIPEIEKMYVAMSNREAINFPVVREQLGYADAVFGFKAGFDRIGPFLGVKAGGFWPGNTRKGLANHQSTVLLFDADSGSPKALVRGTRLTSLRTAAASAISIKYLARQDASILGILGAGAQSMLQICAALQQRPFTTLLIADQDPDQALNLAREFSGRHLEVECCSAEHMANAADVIITVTPSQSAVIHDDWVSPGTHLACMGADTIGKQEVDSALLCHAQVFCDEVAQAVVIGECQHAINEGLIRKQQIVPVGDVIAARHSGRVSQNEITLFDSTGVGLQDVVAASAALKIALDLGALTPL